MPRVGQQALAGKNTIPSINWIKPYQWHGVQVSERPGEVQAVGTCPWCKREGKFGVNVEDGRWRCLVCGTGTDRGGGNIHTFFRLLHDDSDKATTDYKPLAERRKLLYPDTLMRWGVCKSVLTGEWLVPGYNHQGLLCNLYRYVQQYDRDKKRNYWTLLNGPSIKHQLHGVNLYKKGCRTVYLCEGPWDAMVLWEVLKGVKRFDGKLLPTASETASLLNESSVLAVPGAGIWYPAWNELLAGKTVVILYDSDHPREVNGKKQLGAGYQGTKRVVSELCKAEGQPDEVLYLHWGKDGYDPSLKHGYDVSDLLTQGTTLAERLPYLEQLFDKLEPVPSEWVVGKKNASKAASGHVDLELKPCSSWQTLVTSWRKALKWTDGLDVTLSVMLASVASTKQVGDQLWIRVLGPASCGKSTLCEALSVNKKYTLAKSTIRGFHSGFQTDREGKEDNSLISKLGGKTLITKDGDTLLQSPNLGQILSEARDIYDTTSRSSYRNKMGRDYEGKRITWLLCGTPSLRTLDSSELGERFLTVNVMEGIDPDLEDEILWRKVNQAEQALNMEADGCATTHNSPEMVECMQLTGGYVSYLRENATQLLQAVTISETAKRKCMALGKFVAYARARPSKKQDESAEREFAARLVSQIVRLAKCLAVVLNKKTINDEVMRRVVKVAMDTSQGKVLDLFHHLRKAGADGAEGKALALHTHQAPESTGSLLKFLRRIHAVEYFTQIISKGIQGKHKWRLSDRVRKLYDEVHQGLEV